MRLEITRKGKYEVTLQDKTSDILLWKKNVEIETKNNVTNLYGSLGYCQHILNFSRKCQNLIFEVILFEDVTKKTRNKATKLYEKLGRL